MQALVSIYASITRLLEALAPWIALLLLRLLLAWEFGESGFEKLHGSNYFTELEFPFPFNLLPAEFSWQLSTWVEILGAFALLLGIATRFSVIALMGLTVVAIAAVHWPSHWDTFGELLKGYRIVDEEEDGFGNYKLPLMYLVMFVPLLLGGAGKFSLDYLLKTKVLKVQEK